MAKNKSGTNKPSGLSSEAAKVGKSLGLEASEIAQVQGEILKGSIRNTTELYNALRRINEQHVENTKQLQEQVDLQDAYLDLTQSLQKPLSKIGSLTDQQLAKDRELLEKAKERNVITKEEYDSSKKLLEQFEKLANNKVVKEGFKAAAASIDKMQGSINDFMSKLPGGEFLSKALGIDKIGEKLQKKLLEGASKASVGLVIGLAAAFAILQQITEEANKLSTETGLTFGQARKLADESRLVASNIGVQLATSKDIIDVQKESIAAFGTMAMLTSEQAVNVAEIGKAFGYGAAEAGKVNSAFMSLGATADQAYKAQQSLAAEALKAGVNVGAVTKDIAENAKSTAKYFGGNINALKKAAVEAAKMGMSIASMAKISESLLDIESSLNAQFEFQAMTGKQINLDKARELALHKDIEGATKEVLDQVGSAYEFSNMNVKAQEKLAAAVGMEVGDLEKSLIVRERLGSLTKEEQAAMSGLNLSASEMLHMKDEELQLRLAEQQSMNQTSKKLDDFKNVMMQSLVPLAETLGVLFKALTPIIEGVTLPIRILAWTMEQIGKGVDYLIEKFSWLSPYIGFIKDTFIGMAAVITTVMLPGLIKAGIASLKLGINALRTAIPSIFTAFSAMGPLGLTFAGAAVAGLMAAYRAVGDFGQGDGPAVYSPSENTIFQGTANDQVVMAPGAYDAAMGGGGSTNVSVDMTETNNLLRQLLTAINTPAPIQIGNRVITEIGNQLNADKSYRQGYNGAGGR